VEVPYRVVLKDDPYNPIDGDCVEFRLTYDGLLLGASRGVTRADHKHDIRKRFHPQLRRLWSINEDLRSMLDPLPPGPVTVNAGPYRRRVDALADRFSCGPFHLVPLVTKDLALICGLHVLMLRPDPPGSLIQSGDIDNRLKTLFDALRIPGPDTQELAGATPGDDENPFFCLLEDDRLISHLELQTDVLLQPLEEHKPIDDNHVRLVIRVTLRPSDMRYGSAQFLA
jgi:hypothetical protein